MNNNILALPDELPIARYRYTFIITRTLRAPVYAGSALRGAFGHALRRASVPRAHKIVPELLAGTPYAQLFEPAPRPDIGLANPATIPPPYLIEPVAFGESRDYLPGSRYQFDMVLLGQARHYLPLISYAWQQAFRGRDGIAHGQGELEDIAIERDNHWYSIYDGERVEAHANTIRLPADIPNALTLHLRTPLRLQQNGIALGVRRIDAQTLLTHMLRRLSLVCQLHFNLTPQADFAALKARAAEVESHPDLHWHDWKRYSNRQKQSMQLGGLMGHWHLANLTPEHSRALQIGQWLHLGKNTTFGLGRYTLDTPHA